MRSPFSFVLFVTVILVSSTLASTTLSVNNSGFVTGPLSGKWFDYVVIIMMENHDINYTYGVSNPSWNSGSTNTCLGNCTYYDLLADSNGLAKEYIQDRNQITGCSLGCYIAITSGYGNTPQLCNAGPFASGCQLLSQTNIVDRLESAHLSWKAYMEDYPIPFGCSNSFTGSYEPNHNPFIYYANIQNNVTRCSHIRNANSQILPQNSTGCWPTDVQNDDLLLNDLNSPSTAPNYTFLTPNRIDDNHDCNDVSVGNAWLNKMVPQILGSTLFKTKRAALFITFDEPDCTNSNTPTSCPPLRKELYSVWASNWVTKTGFRSVSSYTHYSPLRTIEDNWRLPYLNATTDGAANNMQEFFH
ncbi:hypothetical protein E6H19_03210 [Candidatus Bathyarchaeota archaeon]|nr:MAG: hypothetical protein E6H19_03210 [Candidatus Bathyarchaeota archaeon]